MKNVLRNKVKNMTEKEVLNLIINNIEKVDSVLELQEASNFRLLETDLIDIFRDRDRVLKQSLSSKNYFKFYKILVKLFSSRKELNHTPKTREIKIKIDSYFNN